MAPAVSIVIPAYREERMLRSTLPLLLGLSGTEVIVVDGASSDGTASTAARIGARVVETIRCRGRQLDAGARAACGDSLFFLHADARPPERFVERITETLAEDAVALGAFTLKLEARGASFRLLERSTAARVALTRTPYGDQGLFIRRCDYFSRGGFRAWPLLEDVDLVRRHRRHGRIAICPEEIVVSARRYIAEGRLRPIVRNRLASILWTAHVPAPAIWSILRLDSRDSGIAMADTDSPSSLY